MEEILWAALIIECSSLDSLYYTYIYIDSNINNVNNNTNSNGSYNDDK